MTKSGLLNSIILKYGIYTGTYIIGVDTYHCSQPDSVKLMLYMYMTTPSKIRCTGTLWFLLPVGSPGVCHFLVETDLGMALP